MPFRLTNNLLRVLGDIGIRGIYRETMVNTLQILKDNQLLFIEVVKVFISDPIQRQTSKQVFNKLDIIQYKLQGYSSAYIMEQELREGIHSQKQYLNTLLNIIYGEDKQEE